MVTDSILTELYDAIKGEPFADEVPYLSPSAAVRPEELKELRKILKNTYQIISDPYVTRRGNMVPSGIYAQFGEFSGDTEKQVREDLINYVHSNRKEIKTLAKTVFNQKGISFGEWCVVNTCHKNPADKIGIFMLCKLYNRHCITYHNEGFWTNVKHKDGTSSNEVGNLCDIHLLHTGVRKYGEVKELKGSATSGENKIDAKQLLTRFAKNRQLKAQIVPRETRGSEKRKQAVLSSNAIPTPTRHACTSNQPSRNASKGVNYLKLNEELSPLRKKKGQGTQPQFDIVSALRELSETRLAANEIQEQCKIKNRTIGSITFIDKLTDKDVKPKLEVKTEEIGYGKKGPAHHTYDYSKARYIHPDGSVCRAEQ